MKDQLSCKTSTATFASRRGLGSLAPCSVRIKNCFRHHLSRISLFAPVIVVLVVLTLFGSLFPVHPAASAESSEEPAIAAAPLQPPPRIVLTEKEKAFIHTHPVIRFGTDDRWEPYTIKKDDGTLEGFDVELLQRLNDISGVNIELVTGRWTDMVRDAKDRKIDGLATSTKSKERGAFFDFSNSYVTAFPAFVVAADSTLQINSLADLSGKSVALLKDNQFYLNLLKKNPSIQVVEVSSEAEAIRLAIQGKVAAALTATTTYSTLYKLFSQLIRIGYIATDSPLSIRYSVRKDWPELVSILNKAMVTLPPESYNELFVKWFRMEPIQVKPHEEIIRTIVVDNYYPYSFVNKNGQPDGFSVDLIKAVARERGIKTQILMDTRDNAFKALGAGEINVLPMMEYSKERDKTFDFSVPYSIFYDAYFVRKDDPQIPSLAELKQKKIILLKSEQAQDYFSTVEFLTDGQFIIEDDPAAVLLSLVSGKGDLAVMPRILGIGLTRIRGIENVSTPGTVIKEYQRPISIAVKGGNEELLGSLNESLQVLQETGELRTIRDKWMSEVFPHEIVFTDVVKYFLWFLLAFAVLGLLLLFWTVALKRQVALKTRSLAAEIAERKKSESRLRESEELFSTSFMVSPIPAALSRASDSKITEINDAWHKCLGFEREEVLGHSSEELKVISEEEMARVRKIYDEEGRLENIEITINKKNGENVQVLLSREPLAIGGEDYILSLMVDVTERRRAEEKLRINQNSLNKSQEIAHLGSWHLDIKKNILTWSDEQYRIFGRAPKEFKTTLEVLLHAVHPADREMVEKTYRRAATSNIPYECVHRIIRNDEKVRVVLERSEDVLDENGVRIHTYGFTQDITERQLVEDVQAAQLRIIEYATSHSTDELCRNVLDEAMVLSGSEIGFYHFLDNDQVTLSLQVWSTKDLEQMCNDEAVAAGVWGDCIREGRPVIHNDCRGLSRKNELPVGYPPMMRFLVVPVLRDGKTVSILGVGNKKTEYDENDVKAVRQLGDLAWETFTSKQSQEELQKHREHLEELVAERTADLRKIINLMSGREIRMSQLKDEIKELKKQQERSRARG